VCGRYKDRVQEGECSGIVIYLCMTMEKMKSVDMIPGMREGEIKDNDEGVKSRMTYCKNFCKCHSVPPVQQ
jgi:hypothetical protein